MLAIRDALDRLHATNEEGKALHPADALRVLRGRVNANIVAMLRHARDIHARLESLDRANTAHEVRAPCKRYTNAVNMAAQAPCTRYANVDATLPNEDGGD